MKLALILVSSSEGVYIMVIANYHVGKTKGLLKSLHCFSDESNTELNNFFIHIFNSLKQASLFYPIKLWHHYQQTMGVKYLFVILIGIKNLINLF